MKREILISLLFFVGLVSLAGCDSGVGDLTTNEAPESRVTAGPPTLEQAEFSVPFFWTGSDEDGWVDHFEWRVSSNGEDGIVDVGDTLGLPWSSTTTTDSVFVVSADLEKEPEYR